MSPIEKAAKAAYEFFCREEWGGNAPAWEDLGYDARDLWEELVRAADKARGR